MGHTGRGRACSTWPLISLMVIVWVANMFICGTPNRVSASQTPNCSAVQYTAKRRVVADVGEKLLNNFNALHLVMSAHKNGNLASSVCSVEVKTRTRARNGLRRFSRKGLAEIWLGLRETASHRKRALLARAPTARTPREARRIQHTRWRCARTIKRRARAPGFCPVSLTAFYCVHRTHRYYYTVSRSMSADLEPPLNQERRYVASCKKDREATVEATHESKDHFPARAVSVEDGATGAGEETPSFFAAHDTSGSLKLPPSSAMSLAAKTALQEGCRCVRGPPTVIALQLHC